MSRGKPWGMSERSLTINDAWYGLIAFIFLITLLTFILLGGFIGSLMNDVDALKAENSNPAVFYKLSDGWVILQKKIEIDQSVSPAVLRAWALDTNSNEQVRIETEIPYMVSKLADSFLRAKAREAMEMRDK